MKTCTKFYLLCLIILVTISTNAQEFQGEAHYFSKTTMDMSRFNRGGRQMSEQQKKQMQERMKSWLEKTYVLTFNKEESIFKEDEKLSSPVGGRGPSVWGSSFSPGPQYKNIKERVFLQDQEFFGKQFLIKEDMQPLEWKMGTETKQIGQYLCFKATAKKPSTEVDFSPRRRNTEVKPDSLKIKDSIASKTEKKEDKEVEMIDVVAWYTPQIPVSQGPSDYWGLPGLILEVSAGNNAMLCSKIIINPQEKTKIEAPKKGEVVTKKEYNEIITKKMTEFRESRGRRRGGRF
ncbi:GLPGLI family protein [Sabulilitoribacter arenilitoris]|uniref:GLPGLI family protein n=1 Tax=Wocania arenilitoris TaxID=2044858 RepID=A0AAE3EKW0_9FLAO|nr:GLPGLI family protein [Wocania arenilitoris]MCF7567185.1 GLPGLI family protein [Wocania arenilitoris]